ncbi:ubiquitin-like protein Pup [Dermabacter hominis]|uniref:ubiquitin-like protein Pup n=1 Tax=Dermabacter hominis TaxID=36740 RepID=UPI0021AE3942|nr:ubiquitin-like protein Pup [Dermabacter hominis]MCT2024883.1 ubiquitin-like protein Pup [Dermabacter hominis]MDU1122860.1 ubiquitin-like protein Pup [Dermabacter sp.]
MTQSQIHGSGGDDENDEPLIDQNSGQIQASIASSDDLLDEIDLVLESNAESFVKSFVQKGGQ